jgi:hypothetical protein
MSQAAGASTVPYGFAIVRHDLVPGGVATGLSVDKAATALRGMRPGAAGGDRAPGPARQLLANLVEI